MAHCPAYSGRSAPVLHAQTGAGIAASRKHRCRPARAVLAKTLPDWAFRPLNSSDVRRYLGVLFLFAAIGVSSLVYFQITLDSEMPKAALKSALWSVFFILTIIAGVIAWLRPGGTAVGSRRGNAAATSLLMRRSGAQADRRQAAESQGGRGSRSKAKAGMSLA
jgi:hypothetical protein